MQDTIQSVRAIYEDIDSGDVSGLLRHLTDDCSFIFGNAEPLVGHAAVREAIGGFFAAISAIKHDVDESWRPEPAVIVSRMRVTYTLKDGRRKTYPAAVIWRLRNQQIQDFRIYVDNSTLFS